MGLITKAIKKVENEESPIVQQEVPPGVTDKEEKPPAQKEMPSGSKKKKRIATLIGTLVVVIALLGASYLFLMRQDQEGPPKVVRRSISARKKPPKPAQVASDQKAVAEAKGVIADGKETISEKEGVESVASKEPENEAGLLTRQEEKISAPENKPPVETAEGQTAETKKEPGTIKSTIEGPSEPVLTSGVTKEKEIPGGVTPAEDEKKPPEYNPDETFPTEEKETAAEGATLSYATDLKNWLAERSLTVTQRSDSKAQRYYKKGTSYQKQGKLNQAIESYRKALTFNPDHVQAQLNLATAYLQLGRFKDAEQKLIYLYALNPNDCKILFNFGLLLQKTGDLPSAEVKLKRLLELDPYHLEGNLLLGSLYEEKGEIGKAVEFYMKAYQINSADPGILYRLGRAWDMAGELAKAVEYYRSFLNTPSQKEKGLTVAVRDRLNYLVSQREGKNE